MLIIEKKKMDFIIFMFSIPFLNDIEISLLTSGCSCVCVCVCVYKVTLTILKMCTKMSKTYGIPSSIRNSCFLRETLIV